MPDPKNSHSQLATDLPDELVRRIDALHERLETTDHYTLLGLQRNATRAEVRQAFLRLAPHFHPDRYFGKNLGPYAVKMQRVFAQLSLAHDTLEDDELRAEYTRGLPVASSLPPERLRSSPDPRELAGRSSSRPPAPGSQAEADAARARQQAFAARLAGHSSARMRVGAPTSSFPSSAVASGDRPRPLSTPPAVDPKAAVDALRRRYEDSVAHARGKQAGDSVRAAEAAAASGNFVEAARLYRAATEHSNDASLRAVLARVEMKAKEQQHGAALAQAKDAEDKQEYAAAAVSWARAFELVPAAETAHRAALCFRRAGVDSRRAAHYGEEAVKLDPHKASYRVNLALVYVDLGLPLRARGEIDRAQALDPHSPQMKEAISRVKAMR